MVEGVVTRSALTGPVTYSARFAVGEHVLHQGAPAVVMAVTFLPLKVRYDILQNDVTLERVDSCDVFPAPV